MDLLQPVLGQAIVDHALLERRHAKDAAIQEQLGSATVAATMIGPQEEGIPSDRVTADQAAVLSAQNQFPRISTTTIFIVASLILISLFTTGLFVFSPRRAAIPSADPVHGVPATLVPSKLL
jgi:hypothetical protein